MQAVTNYGTISYMGTYNVYNTYNTVSAKYTEVHQIIIFKVRHLFLVPECH